MVTYDDVLFQGIEIGILAFAPIVAIVLTLLFMRHHRRFFVWRFVRTKGGILRLRLKRPDQGWLIDKGQEAFQVLPDHMFGMYKGHPLYLYRGGDPRPYSFDIKRREKVDDKGNPTGTILEVANIAPAYFPSELAEASLRTPIVGRVYRPTAKEIITILLLLVVIVLVVMGYAVHA